MAINKISGISSAGNWNENKLNPLQIINCRASMVPAGMVITDPIAYIKVVAAKISSLAF